MRKKPINIRIKNWIISKIIRPIKYRNVTWCFDGYPCTKKDGNCAKCSYYI